MPKVKWLLALLLAGALGPAAAQHATYRFATMQSSFDSLVSYLRFGHIEPGDVYVAMKFMTGCSIGKFGGQVHSDGTHMVVFGVWDYDGIYGSARSASPWCARFRLGKGYTWPDGTGVRCIVATRFAIGTEYRFRLSKAANTSGTLWSLEVGSGGSTMQVGSIFVNQAGQGSDCSVLEPEAESSLQYYTGGDFYTEATWSGPFLGGDGGLAPVEVDTDCGTDASPTLPAEVASRGPPSLLFRRGPGVPHACERHSLWPAAAEPLGSSWRRVAVIVGLASALAVILAAVAIYVREWVVRQRQEIQHLAAMGDPKQVNPLLGSAASLESNTTQPNPLLSSVSFSSSASSCRSSLLSVPSSTASHHTVLQQEWLESQRRMNAMQTALEPISEYDAEGGFA
mmetsp:Transcript_99124/g.296216  ORF Transcript_99124/g.296216 Transcript_99124/m.296216 type:complete len:397 (+) Transcript_99124:75-1265(+)